jgi:omega-amidase
MKTALIQVPLVWEDALHNRNYIASKIDTLSEDIELIVLPEMFSTGFTMKPERVAETMDGDTVSWMKSVSNKRNAAICGSVVISENGLFRNRCLFVFPNSEVQYYDKRHLFTLAGEDKVYARGEEKVIVNFNEWKICLQVCYDLRFPVFSRNMEDYDLLIYVANWPAPRVAAWDALLKARAIENMCYVIGVNRIGADENGHNYLGHSQALDYFGECLISANNNEGAFVANLQKESALETRKHLPFLNDRDSFTVK